MIEIVSEKEPNLKNLKQIGSPRNENKIYIENTVFLKMMEENYKEKQVYVLMGHTERGDGNYATFIEAAITVPDMEFSGGIPQWNNTIWNDVFREIKRLYEELIIVGWAIDLKGMQAKMSMDLERIHREYFGGVHQILLLMDSQEREENFYTYKDNKLCTKSGFYIYYHSSGKGEEKEEKVVEQPKEEFEQKQKKNKVAEQIRVYRREKEDHVTVDLEEWESEKKSSGRYRELLKKQQEEQQDGMGLGVAVAVALLFFLVLVGVYENRDALFPKKGLQTMELNTEQIKTEETTWEKVEDTETGYTIPLEIISDEEEKKDE